MSDKLPSIHGAVMRGTTPTIIYDLGFDVSEVTSLKLYFMQGNKVVFTKELEDCDTDEALIYTQLTQEDTYKLSAKKRLEIRCRFKRNDSPVVGTIASYYDVIDSGKPEMELDPQPEPPVPTEPPAYIVITVLPDTLEYEDGDDIIIDGIEVRAYYEDDTEWGIVPFEELYYTPTTAVKDVTGIYTSDLFEGSVQGGTPPAERIQSDNPRSGTWFGGGAVAFANLFDDGYSASLQMGVGTASKEPFTQKEWDTWDSDYPSEHNVSYYEAGSYTHDGKTIYSRYVFSNKNNNTVNVPLNEVVAAGAEIAWTLLWGRSAQDITVSWDRGDGVILTDDYEITVSEESNIYTDGDGLNAIRIQYTPIEGSDKYCYHGRLGIADNYSPPYPATLGGEAEAELYLTRYNNGIYACRISGENWFDLYGYRNGNYVHTGTAAGAMPLNQFVYKVWSDYLTEVPVSTKNPTTVDPGDLHPL